MNSTSRVTHYSESVFTVKGHGVHTAMLTLADAQKSLGADVKINSWSRHDVLHVHSAGPLALARLLHHRGLRAASAHVTPSTLTGSVSGERILRPALRRYMQHFYNSADLVLAVSEHARTELREIGVRSRIEVVANGVHTEPYLQIERPHHNDNEDTPNEDRITVLGVGQLQPRKGIETFIELATKLDHIKFVWVGDFLFGPLSAGRAHINRLIRDAPRNLHFTGQVPHSDVMNHYAMADIFLLPSQHETFGLAPVEAALSGLPLVLSSIPVFAEVFGEAGADYMSAKSTDEYINIVKQLAGSSALRLELGQRARARALNYDSRPVASQILDLY